jgi:hypothetical protein
MMDVVVAHDHNKRLEVSFALTLKDAYSKNLMHTFNEIVIYVFTTLSIDIVKECKKNAFEQFCKDNRIGGKYFDDKKITVNVYTSITDEDIDRIILQFYKINEISENRELMHINKPFSYLIVDDLIDNCYVEFNEGKMFQQYKYNSSFFERLFSIKNDLRLGIIISSNTCMKAIKYKCSRIYYYVNKYEEIMDDIHEFTQLEMKDQPTFENDVKMCMRSMRDTNIILIQRNQASLINKLIVTQSLKVPEWNVSPSINTFVFSGGM